MWVVGFCFSKYLTDLLKYFHMCFSEFSQSFFHSFYIVSDYFVPNYPIDNIYSLAKARFYTEQALVQKTHCPNMTTKILRAFHSQQDQPFLNFFQIQMLRSPSSRNLSGRNVASFCLVAPYLKRKVRAQSPGRTGFIAWPKTQHGGQYWTQMPFLH